MIRAMGADLQFYTDMLSTLPIDLPADIYLLDNISTITVSFDCSNLGTKTMIIPVRMCCQQCFHQSSFARSGKSGNNN